MDDIAGVIIRLYTAIEHSRHQERYEAKMMLQDWRDGADYSPTQKKLAELLLPLVEG